MPPAIAPSFYSTDLAGLLDTSPSPLRILKRIRYLTHQYVNEAILRDRLEELPAQLEQPQVRPWQPIPWADVQANQLVGITPATFCALL
ncbi:MAG: ferritin-like domain-containing protein, partial [Cyanobacteria bacterium P01_H01_bin.58]